MSDDRGDATDRDPVEFGARTPPVEWAMAAVGAVIVVVVLAVLLAEGLGGGSQAPTFRVVVSAVQSVGDQHLLTAEVTNTGGTPVSAVEVEGAVGTAPPSTATIDHLPAGASGTVGLLFDDPPGLLDDVSVSVVGFSFP